MKKSIFMAIPLSLLLASCSIGGAKTTNTTENPIETTTKKTASFRSRFFLTYAQLIIGK